MLYDAMLSSIVLVVYDSGRREFIHLVIPPEQRPTL